MFLLDKKQSSSLNKYEITSFLEKNNGKLSILNSYFLEKLKTINSDGEREVKEEYRPDLLSYDIYNTHLLWNILLIYNGLYTPFQLYKGKVIKYININKIEELYNETSAFQNKRNLKIQNKPALEETTIENTEKMFIFKQKISSTNWKIFHTLKSQNLILIVQFEETDINGNITLSTLSPLLYTVTYLSDDNILLSMNDTIKRKGQCILNKS